MMEISNENLETVNDPRWLRGFNNMLSSEMASWWKTKKWWMYALIWSGIINLMVFLLFSLDDVIFSNSARVRQGMTFYAVFGFIASSIGIIIAMQDVIIGEKQTGTAAWVLSKPISRRSYILAKFVSHFIGTMTTMIIIPSIFVYLQVGIFHTHWLSIWGMVKAISLLIVNGLFFLTLTLLLGTLFENRAPLLGISLGFLFGMQYLTSIDDRLIEFIPYPIGNPVLDDPLIVQGIFNETLWTYNPIFFCLISSLIFMIFAIIRFNMEEF